MFVIYNFSCVVNFVRCFFVFGKNGFKKSRVIKHNMRVSNVYDKCTGMHARCYKTQMESWTKTARNVLS